MRIWSHVGRDLLVFVWGCDYELVGGVAGDSGGEAAKRSFGSFLYFLGSNRPRLFFLFTSSSVPDRRNFSACSTRRCRVTSSRSFAGWWLFLMALATMLTTANLLASCMQLPFYFTLMPWTRAMCNSNSS